MFLIETKGNEYICKNWKTEPLAGGGRLLTLDGIQDAVAETYVGELAPDETFTISNAKGKK